MASLDQMQATGIYPNEEAQCFEAWVMNAESGERILVATCSMCVPEDQYRWWVQQVWNSWMPEWGIFRAESRVA